MSSQLGNAAQLITSVELVSLAMSGALDIHHALRLCSKPVGYYGVESMSVAPISQLLDMEGI